MEIKLISAESSDIIEVDGRDFNKLSDDEKISIVESLKSKIGLNSLNYFLQFIL